MVVAESEDLSGGAAEEAVTAGYCYYGVWTVG